MSCRRLSRIAVLVPFAACGQVEEGQGPWAGMSDGASTDGEDSAGDGPDDGTSGEPTGGDDGADAHDDGRPTEGGDEAHDGGDAHEDGGSESDDGGSDGADCPDSCYCEPIDPDADLSDLEQGFDAGAWAQTMSDVLDRRWPAGAALVADLQSDPYFGSFSDTSSFTGLLDGFMTEIHEGTHGWD